MCSTKNPEWVHEGQLDERPKEATLFDEVVEKYLKDYASRRRPRPNVATVCCWLSRHLWWQVSSLITEVIDSYKRKRKQGGGVQ